MKREKKRKKIRMEADSDGGKREMRQAKRRRKGRVKEDRR